MFEVQQDMLQALACCSSQDQCIRCSYRKYGQNCDLKLREDALAAIRQLQKERNAAINDMKQAQGAPCLVCINSYPNPETGRYACRIFGDFSHVDPANKNILSCGQFKWCGIPKDGDNA